jgi:hypothetical protein
METYRFSPPQLKQEFIPYEVVDEGAADCQHKLLDQSWQERITVQDGIIFIVFSCARCGRKIVQSLDEVVPPATWIGVQGSGQCAL